MGLLASNIDPSRAIFTAISKKTEGQTLCELLTAERFFLLFILHHMAGHFLDHIDLRVSDLVQARKFYDGWLPALGLSEIVDGKDQRGYTMPGGRKDTPFVWLDALRGHRGGANRIAFWADSEEEVNRLGKIVVEAGARAVEGPAYCHDYTPGYYAVFFEDADGNKWEICCRTARVR
jgi:catechol 2,3-dioxygenase-like lactoylglutathione lyase family enzyme